MRKEIISVVVPVYNGEFFLDKCIQSILNQTFQDFKLYLINDGSKDNSEKVIQKYLDDNRIKYISKNNEGIAKTRNLGIKMAQGKYIMFIDNDDFIEKDYLSKYYNEIEKSKSDMIFGGYQEITGDKIISISKYKHSKILSKYVIISPWSKIYKLDFIKKNKILFLDYTIGEDTYFNLRVYQCAKKISEINYNGYYWVTNKKSVSRSQHNKLDSNINVLKLLTKINNDCKFENKEIRDYYYFKLIIRQLFYSAKKSNIKNINKFYFDCFKWINENDVNYDNNNYIKNGMKYGENKKTLIILKICILLKKIGLLRIFIIIYSKI